MRPPDSAAFRVISADRAGEFVARGHRRRRFFPHRVYRLPKCGPDGFRLAQAMCGETPTRLRCDSCCSTRTSRCWRSSPASSSSTTSSNWHREQFGRPGQVASASLVVDGETVYGITYVSDLVQRIGLRREHKTRVEKVFEGWRQMLFNAVLAFALEQGARRVLTPTAELAMRHTDAARRARLGPEMYERIYDRTVDASASPRGAPASGGARGRRLPRAGRRARTADGAPLPRQDDLRLPRHRARARAPRCSTPTSPGRRS